MKNKLPIVEEIDFHYLLGLMQPLEHTSEFAWLPELFSIIGVDSLIELCRYAGGETIKIPTIDQLSNCIDALQCFYDADITHKILDSEIPSKYRNLVDIIRGVYNADNG